MFGKGDCMIARTKFKCVKNSISRGSSDIALQASMSVSPENDKFFTHIAAGQITFYSVNSEMAKTLEVNKEYYIDIVPVN